MRKKLLHYLHHSTLKIPHPPEVPYLVSVHRKQCLDHNIFNLFIFVKPELKVQTNYSGVELYKRTIPVYFLWFQSFRHFDNS